MLTYIQYCPYKHIKKSTVESVNVDGWKWTLWSQCQYYTGPTARIKILITNIVNYKYYSITNIGRRIQRFVCSVHKLLELFDKKCQHPNCNNLYQVTTETNGCCLVLRGKCSAGHTFLWESSDALTNQNNSRMFLDNLQLSSAIVLSGNHYQKISMLASFFGLLIPCKTVFHAHQQHYICPTVNEFYLKEQV